MKPIRIASAAPAGTFCLLAALVVVPVESVAGPAGIGEPIETELPACLRVAPDGSIPFAGIIRGTDVNPLSNVNVRLIFNPECTELRMCPDPDVPPTFITSGVTNADGSFVLHPMVGGCCNLPGNGIAAEVHADPGDFTLLPLYRAVGSPDNGGNGTAPADLVVTLPDFSRFSAAFLTVNPCFDYTVTNPMASDYYDDEVHLADFTIFAAHFLGTCP